MVNVGVHGNVSFLNGGTATALCPHSAVVAVARTCGVAVAHTYVVAVAHMYGVLCSDFNLSKKILLNFLFDFIFEQLFV